MYVRMHIHVYTCLYIYIYIYIYIYKQVYTCICMRTYIHIYIYNDCHALKHHIRVVSKLYKRNSVLHCMTKCAVQADVKCVHTPSKLPFYAKC